MASRSSRKRRRPQRPETQVDTTGLTREQKTEAKNQAVRETLEPLPAGARPGVVTGSAILCAVLAIALTIGALTGALKTDDGRLNGLIASIVILVVAGGGMWFAKYWAVLGFQVVLGLNITFMTLLLLRASSWLGALIAVVVVVPCSWLFWKLVRAMARLQMPDRPRVG